MDADAPASSDADAAADAAAAIEAGRLLFAGPCDFLRPVHALADLPEPGAPEVAFAGRSNVGKSSLLNAVTGRRALARVSHTPGRTRAVNLYAIGDRLILADLPGYGYAKVSRSEVRAWTDLIFLYLRGRAGLRRVMLLVDSRHGIKPSDEAAMAALDEAAVVYQVVLTKIDKLKPETRLAAIRAAEARLKRRPAAHPDVLAVSSVSGEGLGLLRAELARLALPG